MPYKSNDVTLQPEKHTVEDIFHIYPEATVDLQLPLNQPKSSNLTASKLVEWPEDLQDWLKQSKLTFKTASCLPDVE